MKGKVKFFDKNRGFGFLVGEDGQEYFVHISSLKESDQLFEGDKVSFDGEKTSKGLQAINIIKLKS